MPTPARCHVSVARGDRHGGRGDRHRGQDRALDLLQRARHRLGRGAALGDLLGALLRVLAARPSATSLLGQVEGRSRLISIASSGVGCRSDEQDRAEPLAQLALRPRVASGKRVGLEQRRAACAAARSSTPRSTRPSGDRRLERLERVRQAADPALRVAALARRRRSRGARRRAPGASTAGVGGDELAVVARRSRRSRVRSSSSAPARPGSPPQPAVLVALLVVEEQEEELLGEDQVPCALPARDANRHPALAARAWASGGLQPVAGLELEPVRARGSARRSP